MQKSGKNNCKQTFKWTNIGLGTSFRTWKYSPSQATPNNPSVRTHAHQMPLYWNAYGKSPQSLSSTLRLTVKRPSHTTASLFDRVAFFSPCV